MDFDDKTSEFDPSKLAAQQNKPVENARAACFIVIAGTQAGRLHKLDRAAMVIGRSSDAAVRIEDEGVSRQHCRISAGPEGSVVLEDLGSTNGTFCNGERITRRILQDGDKIQVGRTSILKFSYQDEVEEDFQRRQYEWATRDALTQCYNKKYFLERLPNEFSFAQRYAKNLCLAMFDIDHFKKINDTHGHPAGDHVLRGVGQVLQSMTRRSDVLARYGGEEFAVIMREVTINDAFVVSERIRRHVEGARFEFSGKIIPVAISVGVAGMNSEGRGGVDTYEALVQLADQFLYKAKSKGRNRTECELTGS